MLEDQARIGVVEAGHEGLEGLLRRGRIEQFQPGEPRPEPLELAGMEGPHRQPAAAGQPHQQRGRAAAAEVPGAGVQAELRDGLGGEIGELELDDRPPARLRRPQGEAHHARLAHRHVDHPLRPEAVDQPLAGLEGRAVDADVQPGQKGRRIVRQEVFQGQADGVAVLDAAGLERLDPRATAVPSPLLFAAPSPAAYIDEPPAGGCGRATAIARFTASCTSSSTASSIASISASDRPHSFRSFCRVRGSGSAARHLAASASGTYSPLS